MLERVTRMAQRDKNHPSIIMWSLGNESGASPVHDARRPRGCAPTTRRARCTTRAATRRGADRERRARSPPATLSREPRPETDVIAADVPGGRGPRGVGDARRCPTRPLIMCEYIHAMGNSCGDLDATGRRSARTPACRAGSCGTGSTRRSCRRSTTAPSGSPTAATSATSRTTAPFCLDGLVAADRTPHPSLLELAKVIQPVQIRAARRASGACSRCTNEHDFVDLAVAAAVVGRARRRRRGRGRRARAARSPRPALRAP